MAAMSDVLRGVVAKHYQDSTLKAGLSAAEQIARPADGAARAQLWLVQLLLPDLVAAIEQAIVDGIDQPRLRRLAGGLLAYVYNPLDLIGDDTPLGRVDDAIICALGLKRLEEQEGLELPPHIGAICDLALRALPLLNDELKEGIESFVKDLVLSTAADSVSHV
jgi:uncharacterized membrane protein YkvA (DUF1232 family)